MSQETTITPSRFESERFVCLVLHDVAPSTRAACMRVLAAVAQVADVPVTLLAVPRYHGETSTPDLVDWLGARQRRGDELALHGWSHRDEEKPPTGMVDGLRRRVYTRGERIANWVTHGIGLAGSIVSLTLLIVYSSLRGTAWHVVSFTVFGLTLLALYTASTIYHARHRRSAAPTYPRFHQLGFSLLIAATYTPFLLTHLRGPFGWTMFGAV